MPINREPSWRRLDNAAKIFPPNSNKKDTKVFRFSCRLYETVDPAYLQQALDKTMLAFPLYACIMRKGLFWYYLEKSDIKPTISKEHKPPCSRIYNDNIKGLLFEVSYYKKKINLDVHHALTDGVGALQFLRTLTLNYLILAHSAELSDKKLSIDYDASHTEMESDGFINSSYAGKETGNPTPNNAYMFKGPKLEGNFLQVINGVVSVKEVLAEAHKYNTTLTVYLTSVLFYAICKQMPKRERIRPVVMAVPVNLRPYFKSASARNFFSVLHVPYQFSPDKEPALTEIIPYVQAFFHEELTTDKLQAKLNRLVSLERNYFTRVVPLIIKRPTLQLAHYLTNKDVTTSFSNTGKITMPSEVTSYIDCFDMCVSTTKIQACLCSFGDKLSISFTSPFISTDVQKHFFRELSNNGIHVTLATNLRDQ